MKWVLQALVLVAFAAGQAGAAVIAGNWCNTANVADPPAGLQLSNYWSDLTVPNGFDANAIGTTGVNFATGGAAGALKYSDGSDTPGAFQANWNGDDMDTNDEANRPIPPATLGAEIDDGHDQMMAGFLWVGNGNTLTLSFSGMTAVMTDVGGDYYDVYLYIDADEEANASEWELTDGTTAYYGQDDATFVEQHTGPVGDLSDFVQVANTVSGTYQSGNYVLFEGLNTDTVSFSLTSTNAADIGITGFEIFVVPEPASALLFGLVGVIALRRRKG